MAKQYFQKVVQSVMLTIIVIMYWQINFIQPLLIIKKKFNYLPYKFTLISESNLTKYFQFDGRRLASIIFRHALEYWGKKLNNLENNFPRFCLF